MSCCVGLPGKHMSFKAIELPLPAALLKLLQQPAGYLPTLVLTSRTHLHPFPGLLHASFHQFICHCRMVPRSLGILAGTVPCEECGGNPKVRLHVANLENVLNLGYSWDFKVGYRAWFCLCCYENYDLYPYLLVSQPVRQG